MYMYEVWFSCFFRHLGECLIYKTLPSGGINFKLQAKGPIGSYI